MRGSLPIKGRLGYLSASNAEEKADPAQHLGAASGVVNEHGPFGGPVTAFAAATAHVGAVVRSLAAHDDELGLAGGAVGGVAVHLHAPVVARVVPAGRHQPSWSVHLAGRSRDAFRMAGMPCWVS